MVRLVRLLLLLSLSLQMAGHGEVPSTEPIIRLALATDREASARETKLGIQDYLLGWQEGAAAHFRAALADQANQSLALVGLELTGTGENSDKSRAIGKTPWNESRRLIQDQINRQQFTPQEAFYLNLLLQHLEQDTEGARQSCAERAEHYRNDILASCWHILLLHHAAKPYGIDGKPSPTQCRALEKAKDLYRKKPDDALVCYTRAILEAGAPSPSDEALTATRRAAELMPHHPMSLLLLGHMLFRTKEYKQAAQAFHRSAASAEAILKSCLPSETKDSSPSLSSLKIALYEATALWNAGLLRDFNLLQEKLASFRQIDREIATLPLRTLLCRPKAPSEKEIAKAVAHAFSASGKEDARHNTQNDALQSDFFAAECRVYSAVLRARSLASRGKKQEATRQLRLAEETIETYRLMHREFPDTRLQREIDRSRSEQGMQLALIAGKNALYPDLTDTWQQYFKETAVPSSLLLPPILPSAPELPQAASVGK